MTLEPYFILQEHYQISYVLDEQPDCTIYRGNDMRSGQRLLIAALPQPDAAALDDARALAAQLAPLQVAGLLPLRDHFVDGLTCYIVTDDPEGQDLDRIAFASGEPDSPAVQQTLLEAAALRQIERLLRVVEVLHTAQPPLFIGELRSTDVWASPQGDLLLAPFALVRSIGTDLSAYCAPELYDLDTEPAIASDIYALGAVLYRLLTGWVPPTAAQRMAGTPLNPPSSIIADISALVEQVVLRALEPHPTNRYQQAHEMRHALSVARLMRDRWPGVLVAERFATPPPSAERPASPTPPLQPPTPTLAAAQPNSQRPGNCLVVTISFLGFLALLIVAIGGVLLTPQGREFIGNIILQGTSASPLGSIERTPIPTTPRPDVTPPPATTVPITRNERILSSTTITRISTLNALEQDLVGPALYAPGGDLLAVGVQNDIIISRAPAITATAATTATTATTATIPPVLHTLQGHSGKLSALAFSPVLTPTAPTASLLASGSVNDELVRVWNVQSGQQVLELSGHTGWIRSVAFSPDGSLIASGSTDSTIRLWDAQNGATVHTLDTHTDLLGNVAFSPDGALLASASRDGTIRLWDVASGTEYGGGDDDFPAPIFEAPTDPESGLPFWMTGVDFSPDGSMLATGSADGKVRIFQVADGSLLHTLEGHESWLVIRGIAFSPDGTTLASASLDGSVRLWDVATATLRQQVSLAPFQVLGIAWHPDSTHLSASSSERGGVTVWDTLSGSVAQHLVFSPGSITSLGYTPDSATLGMGSVNGTINTQPADAGMHASSAITFTGSISSAQAFAFVSNTEFVAVTRGITSNLGLFDLNKPPGQQPDRLEAVDARLLHVATSPDQTLIAAGAPDGRIFLWDVQTRKLLRTFEGLTGAISALAIGGDNTYLVASAISGDGINPQASLIGVWDIERGDFLHTLRGHDEPVLDLAVQPQGDTLISISGASLRMWALEEGETTRSTRPTRAGDRFTATTFSPDGTLLATSTISGSLSFWNSDISNPLHTETVRDRVLAIAFSPDGERLVVSFATEGVIILGIPDEQ